jgi:hypothetical protein
MTRVIFLGLNPARPKKKLKNSALNRLSTWYDSLDIGFVSFSNLTDDVDWDFDLKKIDHDYVLSLLQGYDRVIALGGVVSRFLTKYNVSHLQMPHPSYRNRALNSREYELEQLEKCRAYLRST